MALARRVTACATIMAVLSACAGAASTARSGAARLDPDGVFRWGTDLVAVGNVAFDPTKSSAPTDYAHQVLIYDDLLRPAVDGGLRPALAVGTAIVDPSTIDVTLRSGVRFSDGTPFDAPAVRFGLLRNRDAPQHGQFRPDLTTLADVELTGPLSVRLHLSAPTAGGFYPLLGGPESFIVSPTAARRGVDFERAPVGAGPFTLVSFHAGQRIVLRKNPSYWDAHDIRFREVDFVHVSTGPTQVVALRSGAIDAVALGASQIGPASAPPQQVDVRGDDSSMYIMPICKSSKPFDDVRVRQALNYAVDRDQLNRVVLDGRGQPQWALWPRESRLFPRDLDRRYAYDPTKARQLLTQAGYPKGFDTGVIEIAGDPTIGRIAAIVQQQFAAVGVNLKVVPSLDILRDYYVAHKQPLFILPLTRTGLLKISSPYSGNSIGNVCRYNDPQLNGIVARLATATPGSNDELTLWHQGQDLVVNDALSVFLLWRPLVDAWNTTRLTNFKLVPGLIPYPDFWQLGVKK